MEAVLVEHLVSLTHRVQINDPTLTHLEPYLPEEQEQSQQQSNNRNVWSIAFQFHLLLMLDHHDVQVALDLLWTTVTAATNNSYIHSVTLPSVWPCSHLRRAIQAIQHLPMLQHVAIVAATTRREEESGSDDDIRATGDNDEHTNVVDRERRGLWHASLLNLEVDLLPLLQHQQHLLSLRIDCPLTVTSTQEIVNLSAVLLSNHHHATLQVLVLHLVPPNTITEAVDLNPLLDAAAQLTALTHLTLHWNGSDEQSTVVSLDSLDALLSLSSLTHLRLRNFLLTDRHLQTVADSLRTNTVLRELYVTGHGEGVSLEGLRAVRDVLEAYNTTLHKISMVKPHEHGPMRRLVAAFWRVDHNSSRTENKYQDFYRLQHEMEIYCRLNRMGRGALVSPETKMEDWIETLALCCNMEPTSGTIKVPVRDYDATSMPWLRGTSSIHSSVHVREADGLVDVGLNEIYVLLRTHPSLCHLDRRFKRRLGDSVPVELLTTKQVARDPNSNIFKTLMTPPSTTISEAFAMHLRKQTRSPRQSEGTDDSSS